MGSKAWGGGAAPEGGSPVKVGLLTSPYCPCCLLHYFTVLPAFLLDGAGSPPSAQRSWRLPVAPGGCRL